MPALQLCLLYHPLLLARSPAIILLHDSCPHLGRSLALQATKFESTRRLHPVRTRAAGKARRIVSRELQRLGSPAALCSPPSSVHLPQPHAGSHTALLRRYVNDNLLAGSLPSEFGQLTSLIQAYELQPPACPHAPALDVAPMLVLPDSPPPVLIPRTSPLQLFLLQFAQPGHPVRGRTAERAQVPVRACSGLAATMRAPHRPQMRELTCPRQLCAVTGISAIIASAAASRANSGRWERSRTCRSCSGLPSIVVCTPQCPSTAASSLPPRLMCVCPLCCTICTQGLWNEPPRCCYPERIWAAHGAQLFVRAAATRLP